MADILNLEDPTSQQQLGNEDAAAGYEEGQEEAWVAVDEQLSAADVLGRIEEAVATMVNDIARGVPPSMEMASRSKANAAYAPAAGAAQGARDDEEEGEEEGEQQGQQVVAVLRERVQKRTLLQGQGAGAMAFARAIKVLEVVHELLRSGRQATQRDLYYKVLAPPLFSTPKEVECAVQDLVAWLRVPRARLGITCASRGAVSGRLYIRDTPASPWLDCTNCGLAGKAIPGDLSALEAYTFQSSARYLLVVEKDAVFQRLNEDRLFDALPVIIITAKGMPDLATRVLAARLVTAFPTLTVLGLVDYNPPGVTILRTYKYGSHRMGLESHRYALPGLRWLGLRAHWLSDVEEQHLQPLTRRDRSLLPGLRQSLTHEPAWLRELDLMESCGYRGDIEAVYSTVGLGGLTDMVTRAVMRQEWI